MQDDSKIEITLITCEDASTSRLIVKAEEKNSIKKSDTDYMNTTDTTNTVSDADENE